MIAGLSTVSRFTQQKPCNQKVKTLKVAVTVGASMILCASVIPLGPYAFVVAPALHNLATRVAVIGGNTLCVGANALIYGEGIGDQFAKIMEKKESAPYSVAVMADIAGDYAWDSLRIYVVPPGAGIFIYLIKEGVKVPVKSVAEYVGNSLYDLKPGRLASFDLIRSISLKEILNEAIAKGSTKEFAKLCVEKYDLDRTQTIGVTVGFAVVIYNVMTLAKKTFSARADNKDADFAVGC